MALESARSARTDTRQRILDAAEELFAQRGYEATPLEDIAAVVGVRASAIFRHFEHKWALYQAVVDRLLSDYIAFVRGLGLADDPIGTTTRAFRYNLDHPNLARLLQHAALNDSRGLDYISSRWITPFISELSRAHAEKGMLSHSRLFTDLDVYLAFNSMIYGFITLASLNARVYGIDATSVEAQERQLALIIELAKGLLSRKGVSDAER